MNKRKKYIITITTLVIVLPILVVVVSLGVKIVPMMLEGTPDSMLNMDDSDKFVFDSTKVTTELIAFKPDTNLYTKIDIHREKGIPRFGIITDAEGNVLDTAWYVPNDIQQYLDTYDTPKITDTALTVWWKGSSFNIVVIDVLTGNIIVDSVFKGQPASMYENSWLFAGIFNNEKSSDDFKEPKSDNPGVTFSYNKIPNGLHFIYVKHDNKFVFMETITKGIKRIRHLDSNQSLNIHTKYKV